MMRFDNRPIVLAICITAILILTAGCGDRTEKSALVLARIGNRTITAKQYEDNLKRFLPEPRPEDKAILTGLKRDLLYQMIEETLILEEASKRNITITNDDLTAELEKLKKEYGKTAFKEAIEERYGDVFAWQEEIRKKLIIKKTVDTVIGAKVVPTDEEARKYYEAHQTEFEFPEKVRARMIVLSTEDDAQKIKKSLTAESFAQVAKKSSLSPEREKGGDLGYFSRDEMPKEFVDVVFSLNIGQISQVLKTPYGFHIFLVEAKKKAGKFKFHEVSEKIIERLRADNTDAQFEKWMSTLKQNTQIEINEALL